MIANKKVGIFSGKWEKVGASAGFTDYVNLSKVEKNFDGSYSVLSMRNYKDTQTEKDGDQTIKFMSMVSKYIVDRSNETIEVLTVYKTIENYGRGALAREPADLNYIPVKVRSDTIGGLKLQKICSEVDKLRNELSVIQFTNDI